MWSTILPESGGLAAAPRRRLSLFLNPLAPSDSHTACSLFPGKFYTTKIDVLEGTGHPAKPRRGERGAPGIPALARVETSLSHLHDGGFGKMLVQTPWKIGSWVMFNLDHNTRLQWKVLCWGGSSMGIPSPGGVSHLTMGEREPSKAEGQVE